MRNKFIWISSVVIIALAACANTGETTVTTVSDVGRIDSLRMREIKLSEELLFPTKIIATCGKIVVFQRKGDDVFVLVDPEDNGKCGVIGRIGRGPNEFIGVDVQSLKPVSDGFVCMDAGGKVKKVTMGDKVEVSASDIETFGYPQNGVFVGKDFVSVNVMDSESEYVLCSEGAEKPRPLSDFPDWTSDDGQPLPFVYMKNMVAHPTKDIFASFYVYFRKIRIMDTEGEILKDIDVRVPDEFPAYSASPESQRFAYAAYPCATESRVYALCFNSDRKSMRSAIPEIQVWDWNGKLKRIYVPDRHLDLIAVDEGLGVLYGMDISKPDTVYSAGI